MDLFGDVTTLPSGRRGRPSHRWSQSASDRVVLGLAMGYKPAEIAAGLGISLPTLRKYYFSELKRADMQRMRFELWRMEVLAREGNKGNVGALKELEKIKASRDRHLAEQRLKDEEADTPEILGKKEQARLDAQKALDDPDLKPGWTH
ncbi:hypothetical protein [Jannaschia formosa]|uniref:hypothetical protein n=1 Tax=Jannaschia formosa TaxID=2259592 RepID=UPI001FD7EFE0|nr:hypothetical protein [Jannaschia formosa]